jgi:hypothetical protein
LHFIVDDQRDWFHSRSRFGWQSHRFADGKSNGKSRATTFAILRDDVAAVCLYELPGDGKP